MPNANLIKKEIEKLIPPEKGQTLYYDTSLSGFGLRVTRGSKTYFAEGRVNGKTRRISIGAHGIFTHEIARIEAQRLLLSLAQGIDPKEKKKHEQTRAVTLREVFEKYKGSRKLAPKTVTIYTEALNRCVPEWLDKPIANISRDMVEKKLNKLCNRNGAKGPGNAQAGQVYRLLRSLFKFATEEYETGDGPLIAANPTNRLSRGRAWTENPRRQSCIQRHQLKAWMHGVALLRGTLMRDYLVVCLLTGLRRNEAASLKWANVDLEGKYLKIESGDTKNHEEHRLPLSDYLILVLKRRQSEKKLDNPYVFPRKGSNTEHIVEAKASIKMIESASGVRFMLHDLRRTFLTIAELLDVPHYALKKLANHKTRNDVTAGYIVSDVERLREPMQRITDFIFRAAGLKRPANTKPEEQPIAPRMTGGYTRLSTAN